MRRGKCIRKKYFKYHWGYRWLGPMLPGLFIVLSGCNDQTKKPTETTHETWYLPVTEVVVEELPINCRNVGPFWRLYVI